LWRRVIFLGLKSEGFISTVTDAKINPLEELISPHVAMTAPIVLAGSIWLPPVEYSRVQQLVARADAVREQELQNLRHLVAFPFRLASARHPGHTGQGLPATKARRIP
jgi:hypothetical protein